jgi:hypothetical protein
MAPQGPLRCLSTTLLKEVLVAPQGPLRCLSTTLLKEVLMMKKENDCLVTLRADTRVLGWLCC